MVGRGPLVRYRTEQPAPSAYFRNINICALYSPAQASPFLYRMASDRVLYETHRNLRRAVR